jgi:energy-coupling factor transporter ATP-binding protein EcfA2
MPPQDERISYLGRTNHHGDARPFGIKQHDRLSHLYVVGKTGVGKSTLLAAMALQDAAAGRGFAVVDPHGDLVERVRELMPPEEVHRVLYLDAPDPLQPFGYNPLRRVREDKIPLAASGLLETFRKLWPTAWGVRMEHLLRNCLYALLERDGSTLADVLRLLSVERYRKEVVRGIRNPVVRDFWKREFEPYPARLKAEASAPIQNKLGAVLSDPMLYHLFIEPPIDLHFRQVMDEGKILLLNVSKGRIGEDSSLVLGSLVVSTIALAAFSRAEAPEAGRRPFFLYIDEFQSFTTLAFVSLLSELRKYGLGVTLAHQYLHQLEPEILHAVLGNAGTLLSFRVGAEDAPLLAREFAPRFGLQDLLNLPNHHFYLKLMIDGVPSPPFSGALLSGAFAEKSVRPMPGADAHWLHY